MAHRVKMRLVEGMWLTSGVVAWLSIVGLVLTAVCLAAAVGVVIALAIGSVRRTPRRAHHRRLLGVLVLAAVAVVGLYRILDRFVRWPSGDVLQSVKDWIVVAGVALAALAVGVAGAAVVRRAPGAGLSRRQAVVAGSAGVLLLVLLVSLMFRPPPSFGYARLGWIALAVGGPPALMVAARTVARVRGWVPPKSIPPRPRWVQLSGTTLVVLAVAGLWAASPHRWVGLGQVELVAPVPETALKIPVAITYPGCADGEVPAPEDVRSFEVVESVESVVIRVLVRFPPTNGGYTCPGSGPPEAFQVVRLQQPLGSRQLLVDLSRGDEPELVPITCGWFDVQGCS